MCLINTRRAVVQFERHRESVDQSRIDAVIEIEEMCIRDRLLLVTLTAPDWLAPFNRAWMKLAELLNRVVSPLVLGLLFFGLFTPIAWGMRLAGRDAMKRRFEPEASSYWQDRDPPGPDPDGLHNQF